MSVNNYLKSNYTQLLRLNIILHLVPGFVKTELNVLLISFVQFQQ